MTRRIIMENQDHEWLVETLEGMIRKANQNIGVWLERLPQLERVRDALYAAQPGFEELWPEEPSVSTDKVTTKGKATTSAAPVKRGRKPRASAGTTAPAAKAVQKPEQSAAAGEKKPRAKRGERLATLPNLCADHPAYGAKRAPRTDCEGCWKAYEKYADPAIVEKAKRKLKANQGVGEEGG